MKTISGIVSRLCLWLVCYAVRWLEHLHREAVGHKKGGENAENPVTELEDELENSKENKAMEVMSENAMRLEGWLQG